MELAEIHIIAFLYLISFFHIHSSLFETIATLTLNDKYVQSWKYKKTKNIGKADKPRHKLAYMGTNY